MMSKTAVKKQSAMVNEWNRLHSVGTPVIYYKDNRAEPGNESKTRTPATLLGGHTAVVFVEGVAGCIALIHVEAIQ